MLPQAHPPGCPTVTFQGKYGVAAGPVLVPQNATDPNSPGFCQSSQPLWSAHRDPSFGHAILELMSDRVATVKWYRNIDGGVVRRGAS